MRLRRSWIDGGYAGSRRSHAKPMDLGYYYGNRNPDSGGAFKRGKGGRLLPARRTQRQKDLRASYKFGRGQMRARARG